MYLQAPLLVLLSAKISVCLPVLCPSVCPHWLIVVLNKALKTSRGLTCMRRPPTFSLKAATVQLRLRYTTMWQSHTRANICDLDATFKYGPIDGSFLPRLYFTSLNANWFPAVCGEERGCAAVGGLAAAVVSQTSPCLSRWRWSARVNFNA